MKYQSSKRYFSYIPTKMNSGKWIWFDYYIKANFGELTRLGNTGLGWKRKYKRFTEFEWDLELLKL